MRHAMVLHDPQGVLAALRVRLEPYPPALRAALLQRFLFEASFALDTSRKSASTRGDVLHFAGSAFQCVSALVQVLYALNARWFL
ncbi:MAG TPA: DUF4037 domain-containing protein, partial [Deinococcales bacterium]|nr:DUF4037 domain-containing protein [Deinococcales bacterium]